MTDGIGDDLNAADGEPGRKAEDVLSRLGELGLSLEESQRNIVRSKLVYYFRKGGTEQIPTIADAMLDRLLQNAHRIALTGSSMRKATKLHNDSTNDNNSNIPLDGDKNENNSIKQ